MITMMKVIATIIMILIISIVIISIVIIILILVIIIIIIVIITISLVTITMMLMMMMTFITKQITRTKRSGSISETMRMYNRAFFQIFLGKKIPRLYSQEEHRENENKIGSHQGQVLLQSMIKRVQSHPRIQFKRAVAKSHS